MTKALLSTPLLALIFSSGGAGLAWLWFNHLGWFALVITCMLVAAGYLFGASAQRALPEKPLLAVRLMDGQVLALAGLTAAVAAIAVIVAVAIVAPDPPPDATPDVKQATAELKAVVSAIATSLGAFVTSLAFKAENIDSTIGDRVKEMFYNAYPGEKSSQLAAPNPRRVRVLKSQSDAEIAVYSNGAIPDWSRENRTLRALRLQKEIDNGRA